MAKIKKVKEFRAEDLEGYDYHYDVEVSYDEERHCRQEGCEGICRCSTLENLEVVKAPDIRYLVSSLFKYKTKDTILQYCLDRLFRLAKMDDPNMYYASASRGYYGEEVGDVSFNGEIGLIQKVNNLLLKTNDNDRVEFVLLEEYGHLLPKMNGLSYFVEEVDTNDIKIPNQTHLQKVDKDKVNMYEGQISDEYPMCVCMKEGDYYSLIDGYHRLVAAKNIGKKKVLILSGR